MDEFSDVYHSDSKKWQKTFETEELADRQVDLIFHKNVTAEEKEFIESRDMFFLATADNDGRPSCSYKGGPVGFVRIVDDNTLAFPDYDGNGMFLSIGNMSQNNKIGLLFIDFENPQRLRVHGEAYVFEDDELLKEFEGAQLIVRVKITDMFINCPRYIHRYKRINDSEFTPMCGKEPPIPDWKRLEEVQDVLPERDKERIKKSEKVR